MKPWLHLGKLLLFSNFLHLIQLVCVCVRDNAFMCACACVNCEGKKCITVVYKSVRLCLSHVMWSPTALPEQSPFVIENEMLWSSWQRPHYTCWTTAASPGISPFTCMSKLNNFIFNINPNLFIVFLFILAIVVSDQMQCVQCWIMCMIIRKKKTRLPTATKTLDTDFFFSCCCFRCV